MLPSCSVIFSSAKLYVTSTRKQTDGRGGSQMSFFSKIKDKAALRTERTKTPLPWEPRRDQNLANAATGAALGVGNTRAELEERLYLAQNLAAERYAEIRDLKNSLNQSELALNNYMFGESYRTQPRSSNNIENLGQIRSELEGENAPMLQSELETTNDGLIQEAEDRATSLKKKLRSQTALHAQRERGWEQEKKSMQKSFDKQIAERDDRLAAAIKNFDQHIAEQQRKNASSTSEARAESAQMQAELESRIFGLEVLLRGREQEISEWQSRADTEEQKHAELKNRMEGTISDIQRRTREEIENLRVGHQAEKEKAREKYTELQHGLDMEIDNLERSFQDEKRRMAEEHANEKKTIVGGLEELQAQFESAQRQIQNMGKEMENLHTQIYAEIVKLHEAEARTRKMKDQLEKELDICRRDYEALGGKASKDYENEIKRLVEVHKKEKDKMKNEARAQLERLVRENDDMRMDINSRDVKLKQKHKSTKEKMKDDFTLKIASLDEGHKKDREKMRNELVRLHTELDRMKHESESRRFHMQREHDAQKHRMVDDFSGMRLDMQTKLERTRQELDQEKKNLAKREEDMMMNLESKNEAERQEVESRMKQLISQLSTIGTESEANRKKIQDLETEIQSQLETMQQKTITLNATRNELNQEKRKAAAARAECARKDQQLEYVQQQCASFREKQQRPELVVAAKPEVMMKAPRENVPAVQKRQNQVDKSECNQQ